MNIHITLLGKEVLPVYYPIKQFRPNIVYIIGTEQNRSLAERLRHLLTRGQEGEVGEAMPLLKQVKFIETKAFDYEAINTACRKIYEDHSELSGDSFMFNLTGGTKIMALAAFAVACENGSKVIYTDSTTIKTIYPNRMEEIPLECRLVLHEIIALHGQKILSATKYDSSEVDKAEEIRKFILNNREVYESIQEWIKNYNHQEAIPNEFSSKGVFKLTCGKKNNSGDRTMIIEDVYNKPILKIGCRDPKSLLLKGAWWEVLVAKSISSISKDYVVWRNVKFRQVKDSEGKAVKNEVDILVNIGTKLLFVECKSGTFNSSHLQKCRTVKSLYGGEKSKAVLVSASPKDYKDKKSLLFENADDNNVDIIAPKKEYANQEFLKDTLPQEIKKIIDALPL